MTCGLQAAASAGSDDSHLYEKIPAALREGLMEFQRFGVAFALAHGGRALIADEMGLVRAVPFSVRVSHGNALLVLRTGTHCDDVAATMCMGPKNEMQHLMCCFLATGQDAAGNSGDVCLPFRVALPHRDPQLPARCAVATAPCEP